MMMTLDLISTHTRWWWWWWYRCWLNVRIRTRPTCWLFDPASSHRHITHIRVYSHFTLLSHFTSVNICYRYQRTELNLYILCVFTHRRAISGELLGVRRRRQRRHEWTQQQQHQHNGEKFNSTKLLRSLLCVTKETKAMTKSRRKLETGSSSTEC